VAAIADTKAIHMKLIPGIVSPMNDIAVQVGGAKAGKRLSTKTTPNSKMLNLIGSLNPATANMHGRY
jgi:hypothetical protein